MVDKTDDKKKKKLKGFKEFDPTKIIDTEPRIDEAVMRNTAVISFGRMNPVTVGHEKLATKVASEATKRKGDAHIFLSHSSDPKKNPLSYNDKIMFAQKAFGNIVKTSQARTIIEVAKSLTGKYKNLVVVAGQDRVQEFDTLLNKYNGKEFNFESIEVVSAGARDPDSEGIEGMSASKMRTLAQTGDLKTFTSGLPKKLKGNAKEVYDAVRKGMGMNEEVEIDEALNRMQRRKRSLAMKRARFKIRRGKEKAERKTANMAVLKKRARKAALKMLKKKFTKGRNYDELSSGEKEIIDKRIERISKKRIDAIARKLLPQVKKQDRERLAAKRATKTEDLNTRFENFLEEASCKDTRVMKRPHKLLGDDMKPKIDRRFRMFKDKVNEGYEDLTEDLATFSLAMDRYVDSLDETTIAATKKAVNVVGPDGRTRTVWKRTRSTQKDDHGQDKISTNENYYKGVPKDKKDDREAHFKRYAEKPGDGADKDSNYKPAPGDFKDGERVKTKLSKYTKKYRQMYGEDATAALKKKSEKTGMPLSVLRKVYNRGVAAWKSGHRPGTTPEQWGHARVNSFVTKSSGTWGKADKDLASQVKEAKVPHALDPKKSLKHAIKDRGIDWDNDGDVDNLDRKKVLPDEITGAENPDLTPKARKKNAAELKHIKKGVAYEEAGAGEWGTPKLTKRYRKDTPHEKAKNEDV